MKNIMVLGLLLSTCMRMHAMMLEEQLKTAISSINGVLVEYYLNELDTAQIPAPDKRRLLDTLHNLADSIIQQKTESISIFKTGDLTMTLIGSLMGTAGLRRFISACKKTYQKYCEGEKYCSVSIFTGEVTPKVRQYSWFELLVTGESPFIRSGSLSACLIAWGAFLAYKGLTCSNQYNDLKNTRAILAALEQKQAALGALIHE